MNILDLRTVLFSYVISDAICAIVMSSLWHQYHRRSPALDFWLADFIVQLLAVLLIVLRGRLPDFVSIVIGSLLVIGGTLLLYIGLERYVGKPSSQRHNYILLAIFIFIHVYFTFTQPSLRARNINLSLGLLVICSQCAWLLLRRVDMEMRPAVRMVGVIFSAYSLVSLARIFLDLAVSPGNDIFKSGLYDTLVILTYQMLFIALTFALFLMVNRQLFAELEADVRERERAEDRIRKLNRIYTVLSDTDQAIVRMREPQKLFDKVCQIAVEQGGFRMTWIGLINPDTQQVIPVAHAGVTGEYLEKLSILLDDSENGRGSTATALITGEHIVVNDIDRDPHMAPWRADALRLGYCASAAFPLIVSGAVRGTMNLYAPETDHFDDAELKLLDEMALDISFALEFIDQEEKRKRAEQEIERIAAFPRLNPNPVLEVDSAGQITFANNAARSALSAMGLTDPRSFLPADIDELLLNTPSGAASYQREIALAGRVFSESIYFAPMFQTLQIYTTDITDRKKVEEALRESEWTYRSLFENMLNGFAYCKMVFDNNKPRDFLYIEVNKAFDELTGLKNVMGRWVSEVIPGIRETDPVLFEIYGRVALTGKPEKFEKYLESLCDWYSISVYSPEREYFVAVFDVITERKRVEEDILRTQSELRRLLTEADRSRRVLLSVVEDKKAAEEQIRQFNRELEYRVAERTAQLEASNKELEAFAYSVSHDLRAPLRAIDGFSRILQQEYAQKLDEEGKRLLGIIRGSTNKMDHLITDLLALSRVSRSQLNYSPIDMTTLVHSIYHEIATAEVLQKFVFKMTELPRVTGDPTLMRQLWTNLISNAIKFTLPKKECIIEISGNIKDGICTYSIRDSGVGFNPRYSDKLFGLFQRLHKESEFEGTGVGLAIVQRVVHRHGGQVWAEGEVGNGATFYFTIPQRQAHNA
jgi:signal transduction histidine kinase